MKWVLLHTTTFYTEAAIIKGKLEDNQVPVQVLNKQDSMYTLALPGMHELYVPATYLELAKSILKDALAN